MKHQVSCFCILVVSIFLSHVCMQGLPDIGVVILSICLSLTVWLCVICVVKIHCLITVAFSQLITVTKFELVGHCRKAWCAFTNDTQTTLSLHGDAGCCCCMTWMMHHRYRLPVLDVHHLSQAQHGQDKSWYLLDSSLRLGCNTIHASDHFHLFEVKFWLSVRRVSSAYCSFAVLSIYLTQNRQLLILITAMQMKSKHYFSLAMSPLVLFMPTSGSCKFFASCCSKVLNGAAHVVNGLMFPIKSYFRRHDVWLCSWSSALTLSVSIVCVVAASAICQLWTASGTTILAECVWSSGFLCGWSVSLELFTWQLAKNLHDPDVGVNSTVGDMAREK